MSIVVKDLRKSFGNPPTHVIKGIDAEFAEREMISISGRSGSGKSTLLYLISTLDRPSSGRVEIDGRELSEFSVEEVHRFRNENMGFVFQFHHLLPELTALENVLMPARKQKKEQAFSERALVLLGEFGLRDKAGKMAGQLSGGEQQRVAIARALVMEPKYLFADEPTGNLDTANAEAVMSFFERIHKERGTTVIYVTHEPTFAERAKRRIFLVDGKIERDERDE